MAKLTVTNGETAQKHYALREDARVLFGRDATCDIVLEHDTKASRRHALIKADGEGGWLLADLDSRNGTRRCIQTFSHGIRRVTTRFRGESWHSYLIIPRSALIEGIRRRRRMGAQYHDCDLWTLIPDIGRWIRTASYGGPGRSFASEPNRHGTSRRFKVIAQSGGLDI